MTDITLSKAVRSNLLSLQGTADLLAQTQERLATGKKVNSALDDPSAFFTAESLNSRAGDLTRILDSVSNTIQTIEAADTGIKGLTSLVETAQAKARQALQSPSAISANATASSSLTGLTSTDLLVAGDPTSTSGDTVANAITAGTAQTAASFSVAAADIGAATDDQILQITFNGTTRDIVFDVGGDGDGTGSTNDPLVVTDSVNTGDGITADDILDAITNSGNPLFAGVTVTANGDGDLVLTADDAFGGQNFTDGGADVSGTATNEQAGDTFTITNEAGDVTATFTLVASADADTAQGRFSSAAELVTSINNSTAGAFVTAEVDGDGNLVIDSDDGNTPTFGGAGDFSTTLAQAAAAGPGLDGQVLNIASSNSTSTTVNITFGSADGQVNTLAELNTALEAVNATASLSDAGVLTITSDNVAANQTLTFTGTAGANFAGSGTYAATQDATQVAARDQLVADFNDLLNQIDILAQDSSYNGINLLDGDDLSVIFNEGGTSTLNIEGVSFDSAGLGLSSISQADFLDPDSINAVLSTLDSATSTLRTQASTFGSNLSIVETRQNFTSELINVLETGAAELTLADTNEEGANLLALQTRQQLSTTALSLASQADQNVLRLF
jgi:flagellin